MASAVGTVISSNVVVAIEAASMIMDLIELHTKGEMTEEEFNNAWSKMEIGLKDSVSMFRETLAKKKRERDEHNS